MKKLLVLDNYDSFTYNLVQMLEELGCDVTVRRNDRISLEEAGEFERIVLSPGPGIPSEAGIMPELVRRYHSSSSILGVCLGHQCIGESFGGSLLNLGVPVHGKAMRTSITDGSCRLFRGLPGEILTGRYHSWIVERENLPECLRVTAVDDEGNIMALSHERYDVHGVQFHPESVLTEHGRAMLANFLGEG